MEYTNKEFIADLLCCESVEYFASKPIPINSYLWQVVKTTNDMDIVKYYMDKLSHDKAVRTAIINGKVEIADMLIDNGVTYNPTELKFSKEQSVRWAKQHGINITIDQVSGYTYNVSLITTLLLCYPHLLPDIELDKCLSLVLEYILTNYNVEITDELIRSILRKGDINCFLLIANKIDLRKYTSQIANSSYKIVEHVLNNSDLTIADFDMLLFYGSCIEQKLEVYSPQILDFVDKAKECDLLESYMRDQYTSEALYVVQQYNVCLPELDVVGTAKAILDSDLDFLLEDSFIDNKDIVYEYKVKVIEANTVTDILNLYVELYG